MVEKKDMKEVGEVVVWKVVGKRDEKLKAALNT